MVLLHPLQDAHMCQPQRASTLQRHPNHGTTGGRERCMTRSAGAVSAAVPWPAAGLAACWLCAPCASRIVVSTVAAAFQNTGRLPIDPWIGSLDSSNQSIVIRLLPSPSCFCDGCDDCWHALRLEKQKGLLRSQRKPSCFFRSKRINLKRVSSKRVRGVCGKRPTWAEPE